MSILNKKAHYVYHLSIGKSVVYVGRSVNPKTRRTIFERTHNLRVDLKVFGPMFFKTAAALELKYIDDLAPKFNKKRASSRCRLGIKNGENQKSRVSESLKGKPKSIEHRFNLWKNRGPLSQTPKNIRRREQRRLKCFTNT